MEANVPWGEDTLFTLEFREDANKYAIHTCNNMYLQTDGKLVPQVNKVRKGQDRKQLGENGLITTLFFIQDCYFAVEYHGGFIALRDGVGHYLAPIGSRAVLKTRSSSVTKDELFSLEDSLPQASFVAVANDRYVSVKQGTILFCKKGSILDKMKVGFRHRQ